MDPIAIKDLTARISYSLLARSNTREHRSVAKFRDMWASLRLWRFVRSVQDTAWLSFHGILPTADRLVRFGMKVNAACFCGEPESLIHLFTSCTFVTEVLQWFLVQLRKYRPAADLSTAQILFGFDTSAGVPITFNALLGILRHHVWLARNKHRFEHVTPDAHVTIKNAKSALRFLVQMHQRHCSPEVFTTDWMASGIVGSVTEQDWIRFTREFIT